MRVMKVGRERARLFKGVLYRWKCYMYLWRLEQTELSVRIYDVTEKHRQTSLVLCLHEYILVHISQYERGRIA